MFEFTKQELKEIDKYTKKRHKSLSFGTLFKKPRTYFKLDVKKSKLKIPKEISNILKQNKYEIQDYNQGLAKNQEGRPIGIGKILNRLNKPELKKMFDERLQGDKKRSDNLMVVFTHDPKDIALMSTGRAWNSCMDIRETTDFHQQVYHKIQKGGIIAYLIYANDKNIEKPLARINIRRYQKGKLFYFHPSHDTYGIKNQAFANLVSEILIKSNKLTCNKNLLPIGYKDAEGGYVDVFPTELSIENLKVYAEDMAVSYRNLFKETIINVNNPDDIIWLLHNLPKFDRNYKKKICQLENIILSAPIHKVIEFFGTGAQEYKNSMNLNLFKQYFIKKANGVALQFLQKVYENYSKKIFNQIIKDFNPSLKNNFK